MSRDSHVPAGYGLALSRGRRETAGSLLAIVGFARFSDRSAVEGPLENGRDNSRADNETLRRC